MCARLLSCPLCSQPGFVTLDALRAGLVSVATRPLSCPVCNETLLGIDKLTIHLFGHTIHANNRNDGCKVFDTNRNNNAPETIHSDALIIPQNWSAPGNLTILCNQNQSAELRNDKISFLNSVPSVAALVMNKNSILSSPANTQNYARITETMDKSQNQMIFVQNSSQQFCAPTIIRANNSSSMNISNQETYRNDAPMVFHSSLVNKTIPVIAPSQNSVEKNSSQNSPIDNAAIYQRDTQGDKSAEDTVEKQDSDGQFSEKWIENLLQDNGEKCSAQSTESSASEEKSYPSECGTNLSIKDEKYSNCHEKTLNRRIDEENNGAKNLSIQRTEEIFKDDNPSRNSSIDILPQLRAFRLLAMKDKTERCNICGIPVPDRNILILHKQVVHMIPEKDVNAIPEELLKNYPCHFCAKVFKNRGSLMVHMRIAHIGYNLGSLSKDKDSEISCCENGYNCPTCGKNFRKEQHVTQHLKTHEGKQWECDVCTKMFTTKYFLKKHKRLHSGEMPYKCTICDKTFTFQQSYHKHRLYHKDDKPHTCSTCGRSFKELSTLHNHERIHTGEKPFVCETCGKCFRQRVSYLVHRRIHTGVMPYKCAACGKSFRYKVSQRTHKCPVQMEDLAVSVPETASNNCSDSSTLAKTNIFVNNQETESTKNENKFVLTVNGQGQPILTRESDVGTSFINEKQSLETVENHKVDQDNSADLWNNLSAENLSKDSTSSSVKTGSTLINEKPSRDDENDFFSLVMTPLENDLSSPSAEMEHLRLSSPRNDDTRQKEASEISENENSLQNDLNNAIDGIFRNNCTVNDQLETINEESLKQLLYSIDRKC